ncbi:hypothetical protein ACFQ9Z_10530 [Streptomyces sp. NPDC056580]|uniref:hypothetical protein n=1 Tax=Streptomyces sp. NPDC056580 TaxID=3345872 RepID=UPI003675AE68
MSQILEHVDPALDDNGGSRGIGTLLHRLPQQGTGADRRPEVLSDGGRNGSMDVITEATATP